MKSSKYDDSIALLERIKEDEMVTLYISSGSNSVTVPNFLGYIKSKAEEIASFALFSPEPCADPMIAVPEFLSTVRASRKSMFIA